MQAQEHNKKPKLVVGIVVDQMRYDYLYKYYNKYSENGFKKLLSHGFNCKNTNYNYRPTITGPGHTSIYTGTTPLFHGIIGNDWYDRDKGRTVYVTEDPIAHTVGTESEAGQMSPNNLPVSTIGDEIRLFSNMQSKVISISLKDRGAILPGGHLANGVYWFDDGFGKFVTSTYYRSDLPKWVEDINAQDLAAKYFTKPWNTLLPIEQYTESSPDDNPYEGIYKGETRPVFPHDLPLIFKNIGYDLLKYSPYGNTVLKDLAIASLKGEHLGEGEFTDLLAVSFSSTDYIGHKMGPQSIEIEDIYLRLDRDIAELISYLEDNYGKDNFIMFLTADHGAAYNPQQMIDLKMPAGFFEAKAFEDSLKNYLGIKYGDKKLFSYFIDEQIYLNRSLIKEKNISLKEIQDDVAEFSKGFAGVSDSYTADQLTGEPLRNLFAANIQNGFYPKRSGDIVLNLMPGWLTYSHTGTTHGTTYTYDSHVPLLWYGWNIKAGSTSDQIDITDIAPTLADFLNINPPNACTGKVIKNILK